MTRVDAAGGVLYRQRGGVTEVLLIYRRGVWDLPKGKKESDETFRECAIREVSEEVGAEQPLLRGFLIDTIHFFNEDGRQLEKYTKWYAMQLAESPPRPLQPELQEGIEELLWLPIREARNRVGYPNLVRVLDSFDRLDRAGT